MLKTVRLGIIGGGLMGREIASAIARWMHLVDVPVRPVLTGICSIPAATMDFFKGNFPSITVATEDYRELIASPDVDAVYCAVPHNLHARMYVDILNAGKHLLGEKPFGIDLPANDAIMHAVRAHPELVVRCSSEFPYFPPVQRIIAALADGRFGRILEIEAGFLHASDMDPLKPINWKRQAAVNGAYGCMGDLGMHVFHVPLRFGFVPRNVRAVLSKVVTERPDGKGGMAPCDTWDNATLLCEIETADQHFPLTAKMQRMAPGETDTWTLSVKGTRYSASFTSRNPRALESLTYDRTRPQQWCTEFVGYQSAYKTITGGIFEFGFPDAILQMVAAFCHQVAAGSTATVPFGCATPDEAAWTHRIFTAALASHAQRRTVDLTQD